MAIRRPALFPGPQFACGSHFAGAPVRHRDWATPATQNPSHEIRNTGTGKWFKDAFQRLQAAFQVLPPAKALELVIKPRLGHSVAAHKEWRRSGGFHHA